MKQYLILLNDFMNELEKTNDMKLIFFGQMLYDRLENHIKEKH